MTNFFNDFLRVAMTVGTLTNTFVIGDVIMFYYDLMMCSDR